MCTMLAFLLCLPFAAQAELSGSVSGPKGEKMAGVSVSAKAEGGTIRTSIYTDARGEYRFPELAAGKYRVWAQAIGYRTAKAEVGLPAAAKQDFRLVANNDAEETFRQLPGNMALDSLPEKNDHDRFMKQLVR